MHRLTNVLFSNVFPHSVCTVFFTQLWWIYQVSVDLTAPDFVVKRSWIQLLPKWQHCRRFSFLFAASVFIPSHQRNAPYAKLTNLICSDFSGNFEKYYIVMADNLNESVLNQFNELIWLEMVDFLLWTCSL